MGPNYGHNVFTQPTHTSSGRPTNGIAIGGRRPQPTTSQTAPQSKPSIPKKTIQIVGNSVIITDRIGAHVEVLTKRLVGPKGRPKTRCRVVRRQTQGLQTQPPDTRRQSSHAIHKDIDLLALSRLWSEGHRLLDGIRRNITETRRSVDKWRTRVENEEELHDSRERRIKSSNWCCVCLKEADLTYWAIISDDHFCGDDCFDYVHTNPCEFDPFEAEE